MAEIGQITVGIRVVPDPETMAAILLLLNLWQDDNPDKMIALVPDHERYVYEIINRKDRSKTEYNL